MADGSIKTYWRCSRYKDLSCPFRAHTVEGSVVKKISVHNHAVNKAYLEKEEALGDLREKALTRETPHVIASSILAHCSSQAAVVLPTKNSLKRSVQRIQSVRDENNQLLPNPRSPEEIVIPPKFTKTIAGDPFVLFDIGSANDRIIVFGTSENIGRLVLNKDWYMDGTFASCPTLFYQLFTIHYLENRTAFPMVFALLPNKQQTTYDRLFKEMKKFESELKPETLMVDFEKASINAFQDSFPETEISGCNFHFNQALLRKIKHFGFWADYNNKDLDFQKNIKMLAALAFVPPDRVVDAFDLVHNLFHEKYSDFLDSFEQEWIGTQDRREKRKPAKFAIDLWNMFQKDIRTNNSVEGWHRSFSELMARTNPTFWRFMNTLQIEQGKNENMIAKYLSGENPPKRLDKYVKLDKRIQNVMSKFSSTTLQDYVKSVSYLISVE